MKINKVIELDVSNTRAIIEGIKYTASKVIGLCTGVVAAVSFYVLSKAVVRGIKEISNEYSQESEEESGSLENKFLSNIKPRFSVVKSKLGNFQRTIDPDKVFSNNISNKIDIFLSTTVVFPMFLTIGSNVSMKLFNKIDNILSGTTSQEEYINQDEQKQRIIFETKAQILDQILANMKMTFEVKIPDQISSEQIAINCAGDEINIEL